MAALDNRGKMWKSSALLCAAGGILIYLNTLQCGLVYDDIGAIRKNEDLRPTSSWLDMFYNDYWGQAMAGVNSHKSYRPLTVATFRLNYMLHELEPLGYHLVNVLLHGGVCYLYVLLCGVVFGEVWPALIAGLLFAVHPIHTEAVTGVVGRAELLSGLFFLTAILSFIQSSSRRNGWIIGWQLLSGISVVFSLLSKEQGVTAVGVCVVYELIILQKGSRKNGDGDGMSIRPLAEKRRSIFRITSMLLLGAVAMAARLLLGDGSPGPNVFHRYANPARHLATPYRQLSWLYLTFVNSWLLLNPYNLCADWRFGAAPVINSLIDPLNVLTLLTVGGVGFLSVWSLFGGRDRRHKVVAFSLALLVLPYLPASNLFFPVGFVVAERVLYLPSMGFCMLVAFGASQILKKSQKISKLSHRIVQSCILFLILTSSIKTVTRNGDWQTGVSLYASGVKHNPTSGVMLSNLGVEYAVKKEYTMAERLYLRSMSVAPNYARAFFNFGKLMKIRDIFDQAEWGFRRAVAVGNRDTGNGVQQGEAYYHLIDTVSSETHRLGEALELSEKSMQFADTFGQLYITYSNLLVLANRTEDALPVTKMAAAQNPRSSVALYNLGLVHTKLGQLLEAAAAFRKAHLIQQDSVQVMYNLASVLQVTAEGDVDTLNEALDIWIRLLSANPSHHEALTNLASLYYQLKDIPNTRNTLLQILHQSPNHTDTHYRLGLLDYMQGNYHAAMETFSLVSNLQPDYKKTQAYLEMAQKELQRTR